MKLLSDEEDAEAGPQVRHETNGPALTAIHSDGGFFKDLEADGTGESSEIL